MQHDMAVSKDIGPLPKKPSILKSTQTRRYVWAYVFILPQAVVFFVLSFYPIIMSYVYSLYNWSGLGPMNDFIGLSNYSRLFQDPQFWQAFRHTIEYMVGQAVLVIPSALFLALALNNPRFKGKGLYRVIYFVPVVTTTAIVGVIMNVIFSTEQGLVNSALKASHIISHSIPWLSSPNLAMLVLIIIGAWKFVGIVMIYWLAGLQTISNDLYEAAAIDGAGVWGRMLHITVPLLKPISVVILLLTIVNSMQVFDLVETLTGGGPFYATQTLDLYIYNYAFGQGLPQIGYASAAGVCLGLFVSVISLMLGGLIRIVNRGN